jgi:hypothetical protein
LNAVNGWCGGSFGQNASSAALGDETPPLTSVFCWRDFRVETSLLSIVSDIVRLLFAYCSFSDVVRDRVSTFEIRVSGSAHHIAEGR